MKRLILVLLVSLIVFESDSQGYKYKFKVNGIKDTTVNLANYFGSKLYYADTATVNKSGEFVFEGDKPLPGGKYAVVIPGPTFFEILIDEPQFEIHTDTSDFVGSMKIKNSENNVIYYDYIRFINQKKKEVEKLNQDLVLFAQDTLKSAEISKAIVKVNKDVNAEQKRLIQEHSDLLVGKMMKVNIPVEVPEAPKDEQGNVIDELWQYKYYKKHFFDHCDLSDNAMARLPEFDRKVDEFFKKVVISVPDSAIKEVDQLINRVPKDGELFKYLVSWTTVFFEKNKVMCMDAGFVHMVENYYMNDLAHWVDSASLSKITERAMKMKPTICNVKAPYMNLHDTTGTRFYNLYELDADFTVVYIWDPDCGHWKKSNPLMVDFYDEYKDKGVKVYAVGNPFETAKWKKYLREHPNFGKLINVSDSPEHPSAFRTFYDVHTTPKLFLLDKDKKIIAKQIEVEQLGEIIDHHLDQIKELN